MMTPSVNTTFLPKTNTTKTFAARLIARGEKGRVFGYIPPAPVLP